MMSFNFHHDSLPEVQSLFSSKTTFGRTDPIRSVSREWLGALARIAELKGIKMAHQSLQIVIAKTSIKILLGIKISRYKYALITGLKVHF
ncbi:hypothetical protein [Portibacter lacus]|uniref:hypothetical protein n=1 Tax=Portibacter lacus TaxID=1099794 RepID=UPI001F288AB7|nr:hypothetical protein [Portibacter lacus]